MSERRPTAIAVTVDEPGCGVDEEHRGFGDFTLREKWTLFCGKIRRFTYARFRKEYVVRQESVRKGECGRCGACCKLLFKCPFLGETEPGMYTCKVHGNRPDNCRMFPVNKRDLQDRDIVAPSTTCGYSFDQ